MKPWKRSRKDATVPRELLNLRFNPATDAVRGADHATFATFARVARGAGGGVVGCALQTAGLDFGQAWQGQESLPHHAPASGLGRGPPQLVRLRTVLGAVIGLNRYRARW